MIQNVLENPPPDATETVAALRRISPRLRRQLAETMDRIEKLEQDVINGRGLSEALAAAPFIPSGAAEMIAKSANFVDHVVPDLTLRGIALAYYRMFGEGDA